MGLVGATSGPRTGSSGAMLPSVGQDPELQKARNKLPENGSTFIIILGTTRMVATLTLPRPLRTPDMEPEQASS